MQVIQTGIGTTAEREWTNKEIERMKETAERMNEWRTDEWRTEKLKLWGTTNHWESKNLNESEHEMEKKRNRFEEVTFWGAGCWWRSKWNLLRRNHFHPLSQPVVNKDIRVIFGGTKESLEVQGEGPPHVSIFSLSHFGAKNMGLKLCDFNSVAASCTPFSHSIPYREFWTMTQSLLNWIPLLIIKNNETRNFIGIIYYPSFF